MRAQRFGKRARRRHRVGADLVVQAADERFVERERSGAVAGFGTQHEVAAQRHFAPLVERATPPSVAQRARIISCGAFAQDQEIQVCQLARAEPLARSNEERFVEARHEVRTIAVDGARTPFGIGTFPFESVHVELERSGRIPSDVRAVAAHVALAARGEGAAQVVEMPAQVRARLVFGVVRPQGEGDVVARLRAVTV